MRKSENGAKTRVEGEETAPADPPQAFSLRSKARGPRVRGHVSQKRATGGPGQKRSERKAVPAENENNEREIV